MNGLAQLEVQCDEQVVIVTITGEIDLSNSVALERAIVDSVPNTAHGIVVDAGGTSYIDSSGIRLLLVLASRARDRGQSLFVVAPETSRVRRVVTLAGVDGALCLQPTVDAARERIMAS
jgi:anti-anti-sigma factor